MLCGSGENLPEGHVNVYLRDSSRERERDKALPSLSEGLTSYIFSSHCWLANAW